MTFGVVVTCVVSTFCVVTTGAAATDTPAEIVISPPDPVQVSTNTLSDFKFVNVCVPVTPLSPAVQSPPVLRQDVVFVDDQDKRVEPSYAAAEGVVVKVSFGGGGRVID
jgi:hypothetical protein